ncbi:hypothetical protein J8F10_06080 [Gemmata sp. G18]|uniref:WD40 repeat domain-containing protein n=1 Tax=Gemmata palustris TaxID=2822762 RepID=A0ABS5BMA6_9BACT|nr:WD40 repeat domain-containing protein [Gemmata palustris]MBP3954850.1 hypothetical protein [Gemmata palustris]
MRSLTRKLSLVGVLACYLASGFRAEAAEPPLDEPLPEGAVARLGTTRLRHGHYVCAVAFSPDGKLLASGGYDYTLNVWEVATGKRLWTAPEQGYYVTSVAFSPDGKTLASTAQVKSAQLWEATTGKKLLSLDGHTDVIQSLCFAPDGKTVATASHDRSVRLWDPTTGKERYQFKQHQQKVYCVAFAPDGKTIASADSADIAGVGQTEEKDGNCTILLWDPAVGKVRHQMPKAHLGWVYDLAFSPDGQTLASASPYRGCLWDVAGGKLIDRFADRTNKVAFAPDGKSIAWCKDGVRLYNAATGQERRPFRVYNPWLMCLTFSPDGQHIAAGGADGLVYLWKAASGEEAVKRPGHRFHIHAATISPDGQLIATGSDDATVRVWGTATGQELRTFSLSDDYSLWGGQFGYNLSHTGPTGVGAVRFSSDGELVAATTPWRTAVWEVNTGRAVLKRDQGGTALAMTAGKTLAFAARREGEVQVWNLTTGKEIRRLRPQGPDSRDVVVSALTFSPDGNILATGSSPGHYRERGESTETIHFWDIETGKEVRKFRPDKSPPSALFFSPDGEVLASAAPGEPPVQFWSVQAGQELRGLGARQERNRRDPGLVAFSSDGRLMATRGKVGIVVSEVASGKEVLQLLGAPGAVTTALAFFPNGRNLLSGSTDTTGLIWDLVPERGVLEKKAKTLGAKDLDQLWSDLAGDDAAGAHRAVWTLVLAREPAVALLKERLRATPGPDPNRISGLITDLDSDKLATRQAAAKELLTFGAGAEEALFKALRNKPTLELRKRIEGLLAELRQRPLASDELRQGRAVQVLELLGTAEARNVLQPLAQAAGESRLRRDAQAALKRLSAR